MNAEMENRIKEAARIHLKQARDGDWEHTLRAVRYGKYLLEHEEGNPEIVIPSLYLHDIGWSGVDYSDFHQAPAYYKHTAASVDLHMRVGAKMAAEILTRLEYDKTVRETIITIVAVHDDTNAVFAMNDLSATLVVEADRLDRYGMESLERYKAMFGASYLTGSELEGAKKSRREGLKEWFRTPTASALAMKLAEEMGWIS